MTIVHCIRNYLIRLLFECSLCLSRNRFKFEVLGCYETRLNNMKLNIINRENSCHQAMNLGRSSRLVLPHASCVGSPHAQFKGLGLETATVPYIMDPST